MTKRTQAQSRQKFFSQPVIYLALVGLLVVSSGQAARADFMDVAAMGVQGAFDRAVSSWGNLVNATEQNLNTKSLLLANDQASLNNWNATTTVAPIMGVASDYYTPPRDSHFYVSDCAKSQIHATRKAASQQSNALALSIAAAPLPQNTPAAQADTYCNKDPFKPKGGGSSPNDPEAELNKLSNCPGANGKHDRENRSPKAVTEPIQYVAPSDMAVPKASSPFDLFPSAMDEAHATAYAALGYCRNIAPKAPPLPAAGTKLTVGALSAVAGRAEFDSLNSGIYSKCLKAFTARLQYSNSMQAKQYQDLHDKQELACKMDYALHIISDVAYTDCQTNGRSDRQAEYDFAHRFDNPDYLSITMEQYKPDTRAIIQAIAGPEPSNFDKHVAEEEISISPLPSNSIASVSQSQASTVSP